MPPIKQSLEECVSNGITSSRQFSTPEGSRKRYKKEERKKGRERERKGEGAAATAAVRARCPGHGSPTGSPAKGWRGVAMETLHCFPFPNYMAAGCQLEPLKRIPAVDGKVRRHRCAPPSSFLEAFASRVAAGRGVP